VAEQAATSDVAGAGGYIAGESVLLCYFLCLLNFFLSLPLVWCEYNNQQKVIFYFNIKDFFSEINS
jgi:hypothetical protein